MYRILSSIILLALAACAHAQLRIVSLNASNSGSATAQPRTGMDLILSAIGSTVSDDPLILGDSGITRPVDILCLQESHTSATTATGYANLLNQIYATTRYAAGALDGATTGAGTQVVVYNTEAVELLGMAAIGTTSITGAPRQPLRYQFRPRGFISAAADLFIYNTHMKAGSTATDESRRLVEAASLRTDADALGPDRNILYLGDFNMQRSNEAAYQHFLAPGPAQAIDPLNATGTWRDNPDYIAIHTQSPWDPALAAQTGFTGTGGGVDDRYDFQLISTALNAGDSGVQYALNSYFAFGNNGSHQMNEPINTGTAASPIVLNALAGILDHLPVVADYHLRPRAGLVHPGDANLSLTTDLSDFAIVAANFNLTGTDWFRGDFDATSTTTLADFSILAANFNTTAPVSRAIPEPTIAGLASALLLTVAERAARIAHRGERKSV